MLPRVRTRSACSAECSRSCISRSASSVAMTEPSDLSSRVASSACSGESRCHRGEEESEKKTSALLDKDGRCIGQDHARSSPKLDALVRVIR